MSFCAICYLRILCRSPRGSNPEQQHPFSDLKRDLGDLLKFSFNSLMLLLAILAISGSKLLLPALLAHLIYSISLRLAVNACFLQKHPTLSRFLYIIPLFGIFCMACVELVFDVRSPALAVIILLLSVLPVITAIAHHGILHEDAPLPIRMQDSAPVVSGSPI